VTVAAGELSPHRIDEGRGACPGTGKGGALAQYPQPTVLGRVQTPEDPPGSSRTPQDRIRTT
jgi:hypothetical protein